MSHFADTDNSKPFGREAAEELLLVCTQAGRVIYQSGNLQQFLEEDLTGRNLNDFIADKLVASVIANAQLGKPFTFEAMVRGRLFACKSEQGGEQGDSIYIYFEPLTDKDGVFINSNSAAFISREINIALSLMFAAMNTLDGEDMSPAGRENAAVLRQNMYRLLRLSRNMQDCALATSGSMRLHYSEEDLADLCRQLSGSLMPIMQRLDIRLTLQLPEQPVICRVDRDKVERMLYNLISNSVIALAGQPAASGRREIILSLAEKDQMVAITVIDRGCGIEGGLLPQALKKHSELDPESPSGHTGAGFGIALVHALAKRHGGNFIITTQPNQGTLACITLPKRRGGDSMPLGSLYPDYAGGLDRTLVELSTALTKDFYA